MNEEGVRPILTVDAVVLTVAGGTLQTLTMKRPEDPFAKCWALPGGYVRPEEDRNAEKAVERVLREKIGLEKCYVEQLETFSGAARDPRGWSLSVAWLSLAPVRRLEPVLQDNRVRLEVAEAVEGLAFDHDRIVRTALQRLRGKGAWSILPAMLLDEEFSLSQLEKMYEIVLGGDIQTQNFQRKIRELDVLEETGDQRKTGGRRAALYKVRPGAPITFDRMVREIRGASKGGRGSQ